MSLLTLLGLLGFFGTLQSPFHYDDQHAIVENPYLTPLADFSETVGFGNLWNRSILLFTFAVNRELGGLEVFGYHLVNVFLHIGVGLLLYVTAGELLALEPGAERARLRALPFLAAAIHLVHPLSVEPVAYLSSRSVLLATFFYLLGFLLFLRFLKSAAGPGRTVSLALALGAFVLACGSKEIAVTLPLTAAAAYFMVSADKIPRRDLVWNLGWIGLPLLVYLTVRVAQTGTLLTLTSDPGAHEHDRVLYFLTQFKVLTFYYLVKLALPVSLNFEPDVRLVSGWADPAWMLGAGGLGLLAAAAVFQKSRLLKFALLWALITVLPTSSLVPLKQVAVEHRTYLPGVGVHLAMAWGVLMAVRRWPGARAAGPVVLALFVTGTLVRGLDYRTEVTLWEDTARKSPRKALVHNNLASAYLGEDRYEDAQKELRTTLHLDPGLSDAYINLGYILARDERWADAKRHYDQAVFLGSEKAKAYYGAGLTRLRLDRPADALQYLQKAAALDPDNVDHQFDLGNAYRALGRFDAAVAAYRAALAREPDHVQAHNNLGVLFFQLQRYDLAEEAFQKARALQGPEPSVEIENNLASVYFTRKKYQEAIPHLERLLALQPDNPNARRLLNLARLHTRETR